MSLAFQHGYHSKCSPPYFNTSPTSDFQHSYGRWSRCSDGSWGWQTQILRSNQTSSHRCWGFQRREGPSTRLWWLTCWALTAEPGEMVRSCRRGLRTNSLSFEQVTTATGHSSVLAACCVIWCRLPPHRPILWFLSWTHPQPTTPSPCSEALLPGKPTWRQMQLQFLKTQTQKIAKH